MVVRPEKPGTSFLTAQDLYLTVKTPAFVKVGVAGVARPPGCSWMSGTRFNLAVG